MKSFKLIGKPRFFREAWYRNTADSSKTHEGISMERKTVKIGNIAIGEGYPTFIIAEIGINHNGDVNNAKKLIDVAVFADCDAIKFQKRNPVIAVPDDQKNLKRSTPWGEMTYLSYKKRIEFGKEEYSIIDQYAKEKEILWFASPWDEDSVVFLEQMNVPAHKIPSACITDFKLLRRVKETGKPIIMSTGMSTLDQIDKAIEILGGTDNLILMHCTSTYPTSPAETNLKVITYLLENYDCPIGYSGHEVGLQITYAAVALGAQLIERHITLDRTMWGTDQAASVEPFGLLRLVRDIRVVGQALGNGRKIVFDSEIPLIRKLRRRDDTNT